MPGSEANYLQVYSMLEEAEEQLPTDPRCWTREHVALWLQYSAVRYRLGEVQRERFPMNGKGLMLLTKDMFMYRVSEGGGLLYEDLQLKLQRVFKDCLKQVSVRCEAVTCAD